MSAPSPKKRKRAQLTLLSTSVQPLPSAPTADQASHQLSSVIDSIEAAERSRKDVAGASYFHPERFSLSSQEAARKHFDAHGYVVFRSVIGDNEVKHALALLWDWLEGLGTALRRDDASTWTDANWPPSLPGGILPWLGIGQSRLQWFLRKQAGVKQAYAALWDCNVEDLVTSFDGICLFRPLHETVNEASLPLHFDQNPLTKPGKRCIQGYCNLLPTTPSTGGGTVIPGSHLEFAKFGERYREKMEALAGEDHFIFPTQDEFIKNARRSGKCKVPQLEAGDMFLWDSRTIHCSTAGSEVEVSEALKPSLEEVKKREQKAVELGGCGLLRAVSFISMVPRHQLEACPEVKTRREEAVRKNITTSHWCTEFVDTSEYGAYEKYMTERFKSIALPPPELGPDEISMVA